LLFLMHLVFKCQHGTSSFAPVRLHQRAAGRRSACSLMTHGTLRHFATFACCAQGCGNTDATPCGQGGDPKQPAQNGQVVLHFSIITTTTTTTVSTTTTTITSTTTTTTSATNTTTTATSTTGTSTTNTVAQGIEKIRSKMSEVETRMEAQIGELASKVTTLEEDSRALQTYHTNPDPESGGSDAGADDAVARDGAHVEVSHVDGSLVVSAGKGNVVHVAPVLRLGKFANVEHTLEQGWSLALALSFLCFTSPLLFA
jgi:hypothetical protein